MKLTLFFIAPSRRARAVLAGKNLAGLGQVISEDQLIENGQGSKERRGQQRGREGGKIDRWNRGHNVV